MKKTGGRGGFKGRTQSLLMEPNVHSRLYEHSRQLEEKKHLKRLTQDIYAETAELQEVKNKPAVNANC